MNPRMEVLLWAQRVVATNAAPAHQILGIKPDASADAASEAFHTIAKTAHPDLHRSTLNAEELELVTTAYARAAGAYQEFRSQAMQTARMRPMARESSTAPAVGRAPTPPPVARTTTPAGGTAAPGSPGTGAMNPKAQIYYRKVELSLRKGDLKTALLQMKMAIAADPQSTFLRTALAEMQAELAKPS
jgi:hypothetical protein